MSRARKGLEVRYFMEDGLPLLADRNLQMNNLVDLVDELHHASNMSYRYNGLLCLWLGGTFMGPQVTMHLRLGTTVDGSATATACLHKRARRPSRMRVL